ncbi:DNA recombination protein RmuC [Tessaracoccus sp. SD287]|uniref:DNA recombination protein RmuC n=1 Tax=Tessaracoccus sp. SD287 TaxID=2782008 RepID=UPI001A96ACE5|nr:DNA recombination protein RmuC [Tessaracoccus sp. SD287]MBO1030955.1 DNA recombination protein RmuC [Tessaracoccus sp. SD287]
MTFASLTLLLVGLLLGVVVGAVCSWLVSRSRSQAQSSDAVAALAEARATAERARAEAADAKAETSQVRVELATQRELLAQQRTEAANADADRAERQAVVSNAKAEVAEARSALAGALAQRDAALAQVEAMAANEEQMVNQFRILSSDHLERQGKTADAAAAERQKAVEALVSPLTQQLKEFQQRVTEIEKERSTLATELREQVKLVTSTGDQVRRETAALATALRKPQVRGQWGELQLKRVVEVAGMVEHVHFQQQATTTTSADTTIRPDMTIMLGDRRHVHVDSKVPLSAFLDAQEATSETEAERLLALFSKNVRNHVDQLSSKQYWKSEAGTPDFVIMFIPAEALYVEAVNRMPDLIQYAADKAIIIASPTSLIGLLKTVSHSWRQVALAENAAQVLTLARELHDRLGKMGSHVDKLGRALGTAVNAYNDSVGSLEGRVLPSARKLSDLNVTDAELVSPRHVDADVRPLSAPELLQARDAQQAITAGPDEVLEQSGADLLALTRPDPSLEELVEDTQGTGHASATHLRKLG